jgi:Ca2+-binding EF-hand superfamily protein
MSKLATSFLLLISAATAWCQSPGRFGRGGPMRSPVFLALDTYKDGVISAVEIASAPAADEMVKTLMAFDKNGDGKLTRDELPERMQGLFDRADTDKDGVLTGEEIRKAAQAAGAPASREREGRRGSDRSFFRLDPILAALDTNGDSEISAAEIAAAPTALKKLDANGDGQLSANEVRLNFERGAGRGPR